jgi:hypothetical protein
MPKKWEKIMKTKISLAIDADAEKNEKHNNNKVKVELASDADAEKMGKKNKDTNEPGQ